MKVYLGWEKSLSEYFEVEEQVSIVEVIKMTQVFQTFVSQEDNKYLMEEVSEKELKEMLHSFQKDKSQNP